MNRTSLWVLAGIIILILIAGGMYLFGPSRTDTQAQEHAVRTAVEGFGSALQEVSLLSPNAAADMERAYAPYVAPELLAAWKAQPEAAPGRLTSSPWPDRLEVGTVLPQDSGEYVVSGRVIEATSAGDAGSYVVTVALRQQGNAWHIVAWDGYPPETASAPAAPEPETGASAS